MSTLNKAQELTLSNGIPLILQHFDGPVAAIYWWVRAGSADESPDEAGFAHFLEHMLFKDSAAKETGRASTGEMARAVESLGGEINAYTSFDQTVYHATCASHHWERMLDAFGSIARPQKFLRADFEREREVILEELRKNQDSPGRKLFQSLFTATYKKHPYGRPVIGHEKSLKAAQVARLEAFYRRNYVAGNMGLVLVGPLGTARKKTILRLLEKRFGSATVSGARARREFFRRPRPTEPVLREAVQFVKTAFDVKTPTLTFSFRAPELQHPDVPALDLASSVLAMGELSRLYQRLFYETSLATDASGGLYIPNDPGMLYFQSETEETGKLNQVAEEMFMVLERLRIEGPNTEELERVLVNAESERLYATETVDGMANRLGFLRFVLGDLSFDRQYLEDLRQVDKGRIQEVLRRYLDYRRMSVALLVPKADEEFDSSKIIKAATKIMASPDVASTHKTRVGKIAEIKGPDFFTTPSGIRVAYQERAHSHLLSVHAAALGGLRLELGAPVESPLRDWGSSYMMSLTWTKGTSTKNALAISSLIEGSAASMDGFSGRNTVGVQLTGLARDWKKHSELFTEVLIDPIFCDSEMEHSRRVAEDAIKGIDDHTSQLCSKLFLETLFEKHPYGHLTVGSLESLQYIQGAKLRAFHRRWIRPERLVVSVVGAVKRHDLDKWLADLDKGITVAVAGADTGPDKIPEEPLLKAPRWVERKLGREQLHIIVGGLGSKINTEERFALRILQTLLGGQSGRLFIELREKRSLAYAVAPLSFEGIESGYIGTYIACAPQKRDEALEGIRLIMEKLAEKGPTSSEMKRAKEYFLGRRSMELQGDSALATHYGLEAVYGLPYLSEEQLIRKIQGISAREVQRVCKKYLVEPPMVTSIVG